MPKSHPVFCIYYLCLLQISCQALLQSQKQIYYVGGWSATSGQALLNKMVPCFETYLTQEVGRLYSPPVTFKFVPFFYDITNSPAAMVAAGKLDFAYHNGGGLTCLEAMYGYASIATQVSRTSASGQENSCSGTVLLSALSNGAIRSIADFEDKKLAVGHPWSPGTYLLGAKLLDQNGLNMYTSFKQVSFYLSDYNRMIDDLISGVTDVAIMPSEWIDSNAPQKIPFLHYHNLINTTCAGVKYPTRTSIDVVATLGVVAAPDVPSQLSQQVAAALRRLNSTHPAAIALAVSRFTLPSSYEGPRSIAERLGMIINTPEGKQCLDMFSGLENILACPSGYALKDKASVINSCATAGFACPSNMTCFCQPCISTGKNAFPWVLVVGLCSGLFVVGLLLRLWFSAVGDDELQKIDDLHVFKRLARAKASIV